VHHNYQRYNLSMDLTLMHYCISYKKQGNRVKRVTISLDDAFYKVLMKISETQKKTLSSVIVEMASIGYKSEKQKEQDSSDNNLFTDIEKHSFKLIIQSYGILRQLAQKELNYEQNDFDQLRQLTLEKYEELMRIKKEDF
jgi:predicted DNA-binding ribbon-helix-helix protein